jgi:hypothetical protein
LCGPIAPVTSRGNKYFLLLVDDLSRYMWVVVIPSKDHAAVAIKEIQAWAEGESGLKLRVLRTVRGGKFTAREFAEYCTTQGVHCQHTVPYSLNRMARWWQPSGACSRPRAFLTSSGAKQ